MNNSYLVRTLTPDFLQKATHGIWENGTPECIELLYTDSRIQVNNGLFIPLVGDSFDGHDFIQKAIEQGAKAIICSKSHPHSYAIATLKVEDTLIAYQAIATAYLKTFSDLTIIGVTGSSGKTSTKEILRATLSHLVSSEAILATEGNTNNHIGVPQNIMRLTPQHRFAILEMGTNHHGEIEVLSRMAPPHAGLITCIGASHLEHFHNESEVAREKAMLFKHMRLPAICVVPTLSSGQAFIDEATSQHQKFSFGEQNSNMNMVYHYSTLTDAFFALECEGEKVECVLPISGRHQALNAAASALLCRQLGFKLDAIAEGLKKVKLPGMRSKILEKEGVKWVNDAYNANPESMRAALNTLAEYVDVTQTLLVLGDMRELGDITELAHDETLLLAQKLMPNIAVVAVGPHMCAAYDRLKTPSTVCFVDSLSARDYVQDIAKSKKLVFLKASRGTQLEKVE